MKHAPLGPQTKASVPLEAVPWLRTYKDATMVIKYGGDAMVNDELKHAFAQDILFLHQAGVCPIVVHGGGPRINTMLKRLGITSGLRGGLRVTTPEVMNVVRMVPTGPVQRELVSLLNTDGSATVGINGESGGLLRTRQQLVMVDGNKVDVGLVGDVIDVNPQPVIDLLDQGRAPIISLIAPLTTDSETILNVNADTTAATTAVALRARTLLMLIGVEGLYPAWSDRSTLVPFISTAALEELLPTLGTGMIPRVEACLRAVYRGVGQAHAADGRQTHSILLEIATDQEVGTVIHPGGTPVPPLDGGKSL